MSLRAITGSNAPGRFGARAICGGGSFTAPQGFSNRTTSFSNTGVAPLGINFHSMNSTDSETTNMVRNDSFSWNFGESSGPGIANWGFTGWSNSDFGAISRNVDYGITSMHCYETPGTYTPVLTQVSAVSFTSKSTNLGSITVLDPVVVYAGALTICFSNTTDFTGAPVGSTQITTTDLITAQTYIASGTRLLFKRGDTFTLTASTGLDCTGTSGGTIGAFGTGAVPLFDWTYVTSSSGQIVGGGNDWRFMDFQLRGNGATVTADIVAGTSILNVSAFISGSPIVIGSSVAGLGTGVGFPLPNTTVTGLLTGTGGAGTYQLNNVHATVVNSMQMATGNNTSRGIALGGQTPAVDMLSETQGYGTILRVTGTRLGNFVLTGGTGTSMQDCSCTAMIGGFGNIAVYNVANGMRSWGYYGCDIDRSNTGEHTLRNQGWYFASVKFNRFRGAAPTKVHLALRGLGQGGVGYPMLSRYATVSYNFFDPMGGSNTQGGLQVAPQSATAYEPISDVLVEHNYFGPYDFVGTSYNFVDIQTQAVNLTARNNVHNHSSVQGTACAQTAFSSFGPNTASPTPSPGNDDIVYKNNSLFSSTAVRCSMVYQRDLGVGKTLTAINNVCYTPSSTGNVPGNFSAGQCITLTAGTIIATNNTVDTGVAGTTWPKNVTPSFTAPTSYLGFTPIAGSYALSDTHSLGFTGFPWGVNYSPTAL